MIMPVEPLDLANCKSDIEKKMLMLESQTLLEIASVKKTQEAQAQDISSIKTALEKLVTRPEFEPVKMLAFGMAGGVLITALGAILLKVLGWG